MIKQKFNVTGMTCAACQVSVQKAVSHLKGVNEASVNLLTQAMTIEYDEAKVNEKLIIQEVKEAGYGASLYQEGDRKSYVTKKKRQQSMMKNRLIISTIFLLPLFYLSMGNMVGLPQFLWFSDPLINILTQVFLTVPIVVVNRRYFIVGTKRLFKLDPNMDSLVAIGTGAAIIYGLVGVGMFIIANINMDEMGMMNWMNQIYFEAAATILTLVTVGKYIEEVSKQKTLGALDKLMDLTPDMALRKTGDDWIEVAVSSLAVGDIILIKPGTIIPVDGTITFGDTHINQAAITGESMPVEKQVGDSVISATLNVFGAIEIEVKKVGDDTTIAQLIKLVEEASQSKAPLAKLADSISGIFVPIVIGIALTAFIVWLLITGDLGFSLQIMVAILVISCPCALGLATPVTMMVGTGKGAEHGILIKSAEAMEKLNKIDTIVLDKTGTITEGKPMLEAIISEHLDEAIMLQIAGSIEARSEHPLGMAIVEAMKERKLAPQTVDNFVYAPGQGVRGIVDGKTYRLGKITQKDQALKTLSPYLSAGKTIIRMQDDDRLLGYFIIADTIKPRSVEAIAMFKKMGLTTYMLTGDLLTVAQSLAEKVGIQHVFAEVMPDEKDAHIQELQAKNKQVLMIGDGVNDAPSLMRADVGMAIGAGTDIALEAADIILMHSDLVDAATAIRLSKKVVVNMKMNLFWAFIYNLVAIPIAAGLLYPWGILLNPIIAALAMALSSVSVVLNALRLRSFR
jgi:P-type Cu+ transporter